MKALFSFIPHGLIIIGACVLLLIIIYLVIKLVKKSQYTKERNTAKSAIIDALGGSDNVISSKAMGSRLALVLKEYSLVDEAKLKSNGVSSLIKMTNKLTLVIGEEAEEINKLLNN